METETGTPIQFMKWNKNGYWDILPAVISMVEEARVDVIVIGEKSNAEIQNAIHADFKKEGESYWDFLPNKKNGQFRNTIRVERNGDGKLV